MKIRKGKSTFRGYIFASLAKFKGGCLYFETESITICSVWTYHTRYTSRQDTMNFSTNFYAKLDIPNRCKERNSQKNISSARSCLLLLFVPDSNTRWINKFFGKLTSESKCEETQRWLKHAYLDGEIWVKQILGGNKLGSSRVACDLISVFDFYCYYSYYPNTYSTSNSALSISFFARSSIVPRPSLGTETFYRATYDRMSYEFIEARETFDSINIAPAARYACCA